MNIVAHIRELVVEGHATFSAQQFQQQLSEQLSALVIDETSLGDAGAILLPELVVQANTSLRSAVDATVRALGEKLRSRPR